MEYRNLGKSGLRVSVLSFGTMTFGVAALGSGDLVEAQRLVDRCLDAGVNLFDTANTYGASEEVLGKVIAGKRNRLLVATKARFPMGEGPNDSGSSRLHVISSCEKSLKRLSVDHIDLFQIHGWDGLTPVEETLEALDHLVRTGKVRYVGISNFSGWHLMKALSAAERERLVRPIAQQIYYSLAAREAEYELAPIALDQGVGMLIWGPLSGGLLSGKYRRGQPAPRGSRGDVWGDYPVSNKAGLYDVVEVLIEIAEARGVTPSQVALSWLMSRPGVSSLIIGARNEEQLVANLAAADIALSEEDRARLDKVSAPPKLYPYWHQALYGSDRLGPFDLPAQALKRR